MTRLSLESAFSVRTAIRSSQLAPIRPKMTTTSCWAWFKGPTPCLRQTGPPAPICLR